DHLATGAPGRDDPPPGLDVIAGPHGRQKFDVIVGPEEPLVAIVANQQLGRHVAKELQRLRAVHQVPAVVGIVGREPHADRRLYFSRSLTHPHPSFSTVSPSRLANSWTMKAATSSGTVPRP